MASEGEIINLQVGNPGPRRDNPININHYATKKSVAESMLDVALFMANVTQLKAVLEQGVSFQYYATLISLISISLFFQVVIGILLIIIARLNLNDVSKQQHLNETLLRPGEQGNQVVSVARALGPFLQFFY
ncbi:unnamed protein product [Caretta caretta]